jgi:hypothetical protein
MLILRAVSSRGISLVPVGYQYVEIIGRNTVVFFALSFVIEVGTNQSSTVDCPAINLSKRLVPGCNQDIQVIGGYPVLLLALRLAVSIAMKRPSLPAFY